MSDEYLQGKKKDEDIRRAIQIVFNRGVEKGESKSIKQEIMALIQRLVCSHDDNNVEVTNSTIHSIKLSTGM